jgi:hypothetical protein
VDHAEQHLSKEHLKNLISAFYSVINSKRRSSYVNNFNDLIALLEKRGYIGEANVGPFEQIINLLPNNDILSNMFANFQSHRDRNRIQRPSVSHCGKNGITCITY